MKKIWVLGDTHFGHNALVSEGHRPADFEARIVRNAMRSAKEGDDLVHLGDLSLYAPGELAAHKFIVSVRRQIGDEGRLILVRGNHDSASIQKYHNMGFHFCCDSFGLDFGGKRLIFSHAPIENLGGRYDFNIHGHLHEESAYHRGSVQDSQHILISMEYLDYRPISLDTLLQIEATPQYTSGRFIRMHGIDREQK